VLRFLLRRLGQAILVAFGVSVIVFSLVHLTPGDPVEALFAGENVTAQQKEEYRELIGLDRPLPQQYASFAAGAVQGDLGTSIRRGVPVSSLVFEALPATLELTLAALVVAMLVLIFSVNLQLFPSGGRLAIGTGLRRITGLLVVDSVLQGNWSALSSALVHLVLPAVTLGTAMAATLARVLRSGLLEVKNQDFVAALQARGLAFHRVVRHMLRNALPATITVMGVRIGLLLGGAIVVETVFSWPGIGRLIVEAVRNRDYPVVQGAVLVLALIFVVINLVTDLLHGWLDPRIKHGRASA
jgi:ABC-type dipeptide/oligopeptide/nickel transport system permease component